MQSKRMLLRLTLRSLALGCAVSLVHQAQADGEKMSKAQAEYQDSPKGIQMCATCTLFVAPHACKVVDGEVSASGWCKAYAMAD